jgi:hypothetical protein
MLLHCKIKAVLGYEPFCIYGTRRLFSFGE